MSIRPDAWMKFWIRECVANDRNSLASTDNPVMSAAVIWMFHHPDSYCTETDITDELALHRQMARTMLRCHFGQALDRVGVVPV